MLSRDASSRPPVLNRPEEARDSERTEARIESVPLRYLQRQCVTDISIERRCSAGRFRCAASCSDATQQRRATSGREPHDIA
jgi:hypothetical protein